MGFYSGYKCDKCGTAYESEGITAAAVKSIVNLRDSARARGWSVGKLVLCSDCRKTKKKEVSIQNEH